MRLKCISDVWRHTIYIIILVVVLIEKVIGQRLKLVLRHKLHDHVLRRTYKIIHIAESQHIIEILIGAEARILNIHLHTIILVIPVLEILHHGILTKYSCSIVQFQGFVFIPTTLVNVLFPAAHPESDLFFSIRCAVTLDRSSISYILRCHYRQHLSGKQ